MCPCAFITARLGRKSMAAGASAIAKTAAGCKLQSMKKFVSGLCVAAEGG